MCVFFFFDKYNVFLSKLVNMWLRLSIYNIIFLYVFMYETYLFKLEIDFVSLKIIS